MNSIFINKISIGIVFIGIAVSCFLSCIESKEKGLEAEVKDISSVEVQLPDSIGAGLLKASCITCHSLRYIEMQPPFPRKTWEKIVDKMRKSFGAPLTDSSATVIVNYLVAIKGKKEIRN